MHGGLSSLVILCPEEKDVHLKKHRVRPISICNHRQLLAGKSILIPMTLKTDCPVNVLWYVINCVLVSYHRLQVSDHKWSSLIFSPVVRSGHENAYLDARYFISTFLKPLSTSGVKYKRKNKQIQA